LLLLLFVSVADVDADADADAADNWMMHFLRLRRCLFFLLAVVVVVVVQLLLLSSSFSKTIMLVEAANVTLRRWASICSASGCCNCCLV